MSFGVVLVTAETDCSLTVPLSVTAVSEKTTFGPSLILTFWLANLTLCLDSIYRELELTVMLTCLITVELRLKQLYAPIQLHHPYDARPGCSPATHLVNSPYIALIALIHSRRGLTRHSK